MELRRILVGTRWPVRTSQLWTIQWQIANPSNKLLRLRLVFLACIFALDCVIVDHLTIRLALPMCFWTPLERPSHLFIALMICVSPESDFSYDEDLQSQRYEPLLSDDCLHAFLFVRMFATYCDVDFLRC